MHKVSRLIGCVSTTSVKAPLSSTAAGEPGRYPASLESSVTPQRRHLPVALTVGLLLGVGAVLIQWRLACRLPESEACVWGRAYLPLSLFLGGFAGLVVVGVSYMVVRAVRQGGARQRQDAA